jgi:hypothetical protein
MTQIKLRSTNFTDRLLELDEAFEDWLKPRFPRLHRLVRSLADWLSRPHQSSTPRSVLLSGLAVLLLLAAVFWLSH